MKLILHGLLSYFRKLNNQYTVNDEGNSTDVQSALPFSTANWIDRGEARN